MVRFKFLILILFWWVVGVSCLQAADLTERRPTAQAWLVVDDLTGTQLRFNRTREFRPIASTTKLVTALAIVRHGGLDQWVRVSDRAAQQVPSKVGLKAGEFWRRGDLLKALLMQSANDAATALAEDHKQSESRFCHYLTNLADDLGCQHARIKRASGLPASAQGATAQDLALIAREATREPKILNILKDSKVTIRSRQGRAITLTNKNRLHNSPQGAIWGKTGYTRKAGRCFAGTMTLEGRPYTIVLLGSKKLWPDLTLLRDWTRHFSKALISNRQALKTQEVLKWQKRLSQEGFNPGPLDGIWGARTQQAFLRWQRRQSSKPDGTVS